MPATDLTERLGVFAVGLRSRAGRLGLQGAAAPPTGVSTLISRHGAEGVYLESPVRPATGQETAGA
jgi:hypothetical protein